MVSGSALDSSCTNHMYEYVRTRYKGPTFARPPKPNAKLLPLGATPCGLLAACSPQ